MLGFLVLVAIWLACAGAMGVVATAFTALVYVFTPLGRAGARITGILAMVAMVAGMWIWWLGQLPRADMGGLFAQAAFLVLSASLGIPMGWIASEIPRRRLDPAG